MVDTKLQPRKPVRSKSSDDDGFTDKYFGGKDLSKQQHPADDEGMMSDASSSRRRRRASVAVSKSVKEKIAVAKPESKGRRRASVASYLPKDDEGMMSDASTASTRSRRSGRRPSLRMTTDVAALTTTGSLMKKDPFDQDSETEDSILLPNPHDTPQKSKPTRPAANTSSSADDDASYMSDASSRSRRRGRRMSLRLATDSVAAAPGDQSLIKGPTEDTASDVEEDLFAAVPEFPNHQQPKRVTKTPKARRGTVNAETPTKYHKSPRNKGVSRTRSASPSATGGIRRPGHLQEQNVTRTRSMSPSALMAGKRRGGRKQVSSKSPRKSPHKSPQKKDATTSSCRKALEGKTGLIFDAADESKQTKKKKMSSNREDMSDDSSSESDDELDQTGWDIEAIERNFGKQRSGDVEDDDEQEDEERKRPARRKQHPKKNHSRQSDSKHHRNNKDKKLHQNRQDNKHHVHPKQLQSTHHDDSSHENDDEQSQHRAVAAAAAQFEIPMQLEISTLDEITAPVSPMDDGMECCGAREKKLCANDFKNLPSATTLLPKKMSQANNKEKQKLQDQLQVASAAVTAWESDREQNNNNNNSPTNKRGGGSGSVLGITRQLSNIFKKKNNKESGDGESDNESVSSSHSRRMRRAECFMHHRLLDDDSISDHSSGIF